MKKLIIFSVLLLFLASPAQAMVFVKNYTRYTSEYQETYGSTQDIIEANRPEIAPRYRGWKAILNLFR